MKKKRLNLQREGEREREYNLTQSQHYIKKEHEWYRSICRYISPQTAKKCSQTFDERVEDRPGFRRMRSTISGYCRLFIVNSWVSTVRNNNVLCRITERFTAIRCFVVSVRIVIRKRGPEYAITQITRSSSFRAKEQCRR